jgi:hypothetical protein
MNTKIDKIIKFCEEIDAEFYIHSSCGLGRPCIGIVKDSSFIEYNPIDDNLQYKLDYYYEGFNKIAPPDAYHKFNCVAVLLHGKDDIIMDYEEAIDQLYNWVLDLEEIGVVLVEFNILKKKM